MSQPPATPPTNTGRKSLPRWALLTLIIGVPAACITFSKLVGMGNIETAAFSILCIFGVLVTYFTR